MLYTRQCRAIIKLIVYHPTREFHQQCIQPHILLWLCLIHTLLENKHFITIHLNIVRVLRAISRNVCFNWNVDNFLLEIKTNTLKLCILRSEAWFNSNTKVSKQIYDGTTINSFQYTFTVTFTVYFEKLIILQHLYSLPQVT